MVPDLWTLPANWCMKSAGNITDVPLTLKSSDLQMCDQTGATF